MLFPKLKTVFATLISTLLFLASLGFEARAQTNNSSQGGDATLRDPVIPASVDEILYVREFELETGYLPGWPLDAPPVNSGTIVILRADPSLTIPRQAPTPILYAGNRLVHLLNTGLGTGVLIGIVPETKIARLADQPVWFGPPRIRGTIDEKTITEDRHDALSAGIQTNTADDFSRVTRDTVRAPDLATLLRGEIADLILEFVPKERALAAKWRLPEVGEVKGRLQSP